MSREVSYLLSEPTKGTLYGDKTKVSLARYPVGSTLLHIATQRKNVKCVKMLIDYHVNPLLKDGGSGSGSGSGEGRTCLDIARLHNRNGKNDALVSLLEEAEGKYKSRHVFGSDNDGEENSYLNHQKSGGTNQKRVEGTDRGTESSRTDKETQDGTDEEVGPFLSSATLEEIEREIDAETARRTALEKGR